MWLGRVEPWNEGYVATQSDEFPTDLVHFILSLSRCEVVVLAWDCAGVLMTFGVSVSRVPE